MYSSWYHDLIRRELRAANRKGLEITPDSFERLLLLHPSLIEKVNEIARTLNPKLISFKKEDLICIYNKYCVIQKNNVNKEQFLNSSFISITSMYPEFIDLLNRDVLEEDINDNSRGLNKII